MSNLQIVTTQNRVFSGSESRTANAVPLDTQVFYWPEVLGVTVETLGYVFTNKLSSNTGDANSGNAYTIQEAFIEIGGVSVQVTFDGGSATKSVANGNTRTQSDELNTLSAFGMASVPKGTLFWIKGKATVAAGGKIPFPARSVSDVTNSQASWYLAANTTVSAGNVAGKYTITGGSVQTFDVRQSGLCPLVIGRPVGANVPVLVSLGNSINEGAGDNLSAGVHGRGWIQRMARNAATDDSSLIPCYNAGRTGNTTDNVTGANNMWEALVDLFPDGSVFVPDYGTNDIGSAGAGELTTLRNNITTLCNRIKTLNATFKIMWMHLMPRTSSASTNWISAADQTPFPNWGAGEKSEQQNTWLTNQVGTLIDGVINMDVVRDSSVYQVWISNGTNDYATVDGTHTSAPISEMMAESGRAPVRAMMTGGTTDAIPDAFTFTAATGVALNSQQTSNTVTITGMNAAAPITVVDGEYRIDAGSWVTAPGTINNNQQVTVRRNASSSNGATVSTSVTIGGVTGTYSITTVASADTTPNAFSFAAVTNATLNTMYTSTAVTVSGIDAPAPISITNGEYSINGGAWVTTAGTFTNNQQVAVRRLSSGSNSTPVTTVLNIGGVTGTFSITTVPAGSDTIPTPFDFGWFNNALPGVTYVSTPVFVAGIDAAAAISVSGGEYSTNGGATWTTVASTVTVGATVYLRRAASATFGATVSATLTIGTVSATFSLTTVASQGAIDNGLRRIL